MKYKVIYADPPWHWRSRSAKGEGRGAIQHYGVMSLDEIKNLRPMIDGYADEDCVLCMWCVMSMLPQALDVVTSWGFVFKTTAFCWVKVNANGTPFSGLGYWSRQNAELCLLATRGSPKRLAKNVPQVVMAKRGRHSEKPAEVRDRIMKLLPGPYLELFARQTTPGWDVWGNEV